MNFLDIKEQPELKMQPKRERDRRVRDRIKAVLLHDRGWSFQQIAGVLLISDQAVRNHIEEYVTFSNLKPFGREIIKNEFRSV